MKTLPVVLLMLLALGPQAGAAGSAAPEGLEKLKALAGEWEGKNKEGKPARASYEIVSNGTAVLETLSISGENSMVTVYHQDGDQLMLTHYCGSGNQPRMRAEKAAAEGVLRFAFADATNLASSEAGHMHNLALRIADPNRLTQTWTWREKGQERSEVIELARKK